MTQMVQQILRNGTHDHERRGCQDCLYRRAAVSWWCVNDEAAAYGLSKVLVYHNCPFWEPSRTIDDLTFFERNIQTIPPIQFDQYPGRGELDAELEGGTVRT